MKEKTNPMLGMTSDERVEYLLKQGVRKHKPYAPRRSALELSRQDERLAAKREKQRLRRLEKEASLYHYGNLSKLVALAPETRSGLVPLRREVRIMQVTGGRSAWKVYFDGRTIWANQAIHILTYNPYNQ